MNPSGQGSANLPSPSNVPTLSKPAHAWSEPRKMGMKQMQEDLNKAFQSAFQTHPSQYNKAIAMLFHFDNDDLGVEPLEQELGKVFKDYYGYEVQHVTLHSNQNATGEMGIAIASLQMQNYDASGNLIILVFSGHGELVTDNTNPSMPHTSLKIGGAVNKHGHGLAAPVVDWQVATDNLRFAGADVLHLLDCCYAAQAGTGIAEVIAATSATEKAGSDLDTCFTRALIDDLKRMSSRITTAANLHGRLMRNATATRLAYAPFYAERAGWKSCIIRKLGASVQGKGKGPATVTNNEKRIVVGVTVQETLGPRDVESLKTWLLTNVPDVVMGMNMEVSGLWGSSSDSTFLQFTVPIELWTQLPTCSAWIYITTVVSGNRLLDSETHMT